jgi:hypothetical protein
LGASLALSACGEPPKGGQDTGVVPYDPDTGGQGGGGDGSGDGGGGGDGGGSSDPGGDSGVEVRGVKHLGVFTFVATEGGAEVDRCEGSGEVGVDGDVVMAVFGCRWETGAAGDGGLAGGFEGPIGEGGAFDVELLITGAEGRLAGTVAEREISGEGEGTLAGRPELVLEASFTASAGGG